MNTFIRALIRVSLWRFGPPRIIMDREGETPYLTRYYLLGGPPTEGMGYDDTEALAKRFGLYLHYFHRSDDAGDLHNHPWRWALSFILSGGYSEERLDLCKDCDGPCPTETVQRIGRRPGTFNLITDRTFHRVDLLPGAPVWTLFFTGPRIRSWGFLNRETRKFTNWRQYLGVAH